MSETPQDTQVNLGSVKRWYPTIVYDGLGYEPVAYAEIDRIGAEYPRIVRLRDPGELPHGTKLYAMHAPAPPLEPRP